MTELERSLERFYVNVHDNTSAAISPFFREAAAFMDGRGEGQVRDKLQYLGTEGVSYRVTFLWFIVKY